MNHEWSQMQKEAMTLFKKKDTLSQGMERLISLRDILFREIENAIQTYPAEAFSEMPFPNAKGYHSKTMAYSIWHIFRVEDIVAHELIKKDTQILFQHDHLQKIGALIFTTGNELQGAEIAEFSKQLDIPALVSYAKDVKETTNLMLRSLSHDDLKRTFGEEDKARLHETRCVSENENAVWLIDFWCVKNVLGLIGMPHSRHWIMHIEAMNRIAGKLKTKSV